MTENGSGLSDEHPVVAFQDHHAGEIEAGMVFGVEAYVGVEGEDEGVKLEEQVLVTADGVEVLSHAPRRAPGVRVMRSDEWELMRALDLRLSL